MVVAALHEECVAIAASVRAYVWHENLAPHPRRELYREVEILERNPVRHTAFPLGLEVSDHLAVTCVDYVVAVQVLHADLTGLLYR